MWFEPVLKYRYADFQARERETKVTIILDRYTIPEQGAFEIHAAVQISVTAVQARRLANRFLMDEVSHLLVAAAPDLVVGDQTRWRVPVWIGFPGHGRHAVGVLEVDVQTGVFLDQEAHITEIKQRAKTVAESLPPFVMRTEVPSTSRGEDLPEYRSSLGKAQ
jgi:hypothetical protein